MDKWFYVYGIPTWIHSDQGWCFKNEIMKHLYAMHDVEQFTLNSAYNKKKYVEIFLHYRQLFVKGNVIISEWKYLVWRFSFIIANFSLKATSL